MITFTFCDRMHSLVISDQRCMGSKLGLALKNPLCLPIVHGMKFKWLNMAHMPFLAPALTNPPICHPRVSSSVPNAPPSLSGKILLLQGLTQMTLSLGGLPRCVSVTQCTTEVSVLITLHCTYLLLGFKSWLCHFLAQ